MVALGAAMETLHTASLVHDDLIDNSHVRRGLPTLNAWMSPAATVLAGDYLFARAAVLITETENVRVIARFADSLRQLCDGELRQMFRNAFVIDPGAGRQPGPGAGDRRAPAGGAGRPHGGRRPGAAAEPTPSTSGASRARRPRCSPPRRRPARCSPGAPPSRSRRPALWAGAGPRLPGRGRCAGLHQHGGRTGQAGGQRPAPGPPDPAGHALRAGPPATNGTAGWGASRNWSRAATTSSGRPPRVRQAERTPEQEQAITDLIARVAGSDGVRLALQRAAEYARAAQALLGQVPDSAARTLLYNVAEYVVQRSY